METYYELTPKARLEHLVQTIAAGLAMGKSAEEMNQIWGEAMIESARHAGWEALNEGRETVEVDGLEVPAAFSALVREINGVQPDHISDIARLFRSEEDFVDAIDRAQQDEVDPRLGQLHYQWVEVLPKSGLNWLKSTV